MAVDLLEGYTARALAMLPGGVQRALSGRRPRVLDAQVLEPGIQLLLRVMALRGNPEFISRPDAEPDEERARIRRETRAIGRWPTPVGQVQELLVAGAAGSLRARHYAPADGSAAPLLVFFHGGGWVLGDLDSHDEPCRMLCRHAGVHVLAVDYRLAPEHPFPAALEDAEAATAWALAHAAELGADPQRVGVAGDSAGGNLAAAVAQRRRAGAGAGAAPVLQALIYPATDLAARTRSGELFARGFYLTADSRRWCESRYVPEGTDRGDPRLSPGRARDLRGLPRTVMLTAAFDPLRDEGEAYAEALRAAGVEVSLLRAEGLIHGFLNMTVLNRVSHDVVVRFAGMVAAGFAR